MRRHTDTPIVAKVEQALRDAASGPVFLSRGLLAQATGESLPSVTRALLYLQERGVADVVVENDGSGWWYALPPEQDTRTRKLTERVREEQGHRTRSKPRSDIGKKHRRHPH